MGGKILKIIHFIEGLLKAISFFVRELIIGILKFINTFLNIQWKENLNIFQNMVYNSYFPDSSGKPSMHTSLVFYASYLTFMTCAVELRRFATDPAYALSTGFWTIVVGISGLIVTAFTSYARKKLSDPSAPAPEENTPAPTEPIPADPDEPSAPPASPDNKISASFKDDVKSSAEVKPAEISKKKISRKRLKKDSAGPSSPE